MSRKSKPSPPRDKRPKTAKFTFEVPMPPRIDRPFPELVEDVRSKLPIVTTEWQRLLGISLRIEALEGDDWATLIERQIIRDVPDISWTREWLIDHLKLMVDREGTARSLFELAILDPGNAADAFLALHSRTPSAAIDLIRGQIATAASGLRSAIDVATDPSDERADYADWLAEILPFHAIECAQLAADDAYRRYHHVFGIPSLEKSGEKGTKAGVLKNMALQQMGATKQVVQVRERSPAKSNDKDTARIEKLGITDFGKAQERVWLKEHGGQLPGLIDAFWKQADALIPHTEARIEEFEKNPGASRAPADVMFGDPALKQFWPVCASMSAFCNIQDSKGRPGPLSLAVEALLNGDTPRIPKGAEKDAMLPRAMHRAYRMTIVHDDREVPKLYLQEAEKRRGSGDALWEPPVTFDKVYAALLVMKATTETVLISDYAKQARAMMDTAEEKPDTPEKARHRLQADGRLWFRLRL